MGGERAHGELCLLKTECGIAPRGVERLVQRSHQLRGACILDLPEACNDPSRPSPLYQRAQAFDFAAVVGASSAHAGFASGQGDQVDGSEIERADGVEGKLRPIAEQQE